MNIKALIRYVEINDNGNLTFKKSQSVSLTQ